MQTWRGGAAMPVGALVLVLTACTSGGGITRDDITRHGSVGTGSTPAVSSFPTSSAEVTSSDPGGSAASISAAAGPTPSAVGPTAASAGLLTPADLPSSWQVTKVRPKIPASVAPGRCAVLGRPFLKTRADSAVVAFGGPRTSFLTDEVSRYPEAATPVVQAFATAVEGCSSYTAGKTRFTAKPLDKIALGAASAGVRISSRTGSATVTYDVMLVAVGRTTVAVIAGGPRTLPSPFLMKTLQAALVRAAGPETAG